MRNNKFQCSWDLAENTNVTSTSLLAQLSPAHRTLIVVYYSCALSSRVRIGGMYKNEGLSALIKYVKMTTLFLASYSCMTLSKAKEPRSKLGVHMH